jgi:putative hydrolase of the HAD superfamily
MLKAILFDLDNTLLDFMQFKHETARAAAKAMTKSGVQEKEDVLYDKIFKIYEEKGIEYQHTFSDILYDSVVNPHMRERARQAAIIAYTKKKYELIKPRPKVIQTLSSLRSDYALGIVTDASRQKAWQRLILAGLDGFFYPVVTYTDTHSEKPNKEPFERALELLKLRPEEVLYVGDNPSKDIVGAKKAGMFTCLAKYHTKTSEEEDVADYSISEFAELKGVIDEITGDKG